VSVKAGFLMSGNWSVECARRCPDHAAQLVFSARANVKQ
jgi:hypothetical protein